jgi:quercetin dioxygenase-like cupin family protein
MRWSLVAGMVMFSLGGIGSGPEADVPAWVVAGARQETAAPDSASICDGMSTNEAEAELPNWLAAEQPAADIALLADAVVGQVPSGPSLLHLSHLTLAPGWYGEYRSASGPFLLFTLNGTLTFFGDDDEPITVAAGDSISVQADDRYTLANESSEPATVIRVLVAPPSDSAANVANFVPVAPDPQTSSTVATPAVSVLVRATLAEVPAAGRLFLACASWPGASDGGELHRHPGPVGVWVERGALAISEQRTLPFQGCNVFLPGETHQTRAAEPKTAALLFGLIPEGEPLWQPVAAASNVDPLDEVTCGDAPSE